MAGQNSPSARGTAEKPEHKILFQTYFKSVGPRTYAAQVKEAGNGNHYLVLTEGKRDDTTGEVRKSRLFVFNEDFVPFFHLLHDTAQFIKANPVPEHVRKKRQKFWAAKSADQKANANAARPNSPPAPSTQPPGSRPGAGRPLPASLRPQASPVKAASERNRPAPSGQRPAPANGPKRRWSPREA